MKAYRQELSVLRRQDRRCEPKERGRRRGESLDRVAADHSPRARHTDSLLLRAPSSSLLSASNLGRETLRNLADRPYYIFLRRIAPETEADGGLGGLRREAYGAKDM